MPLYIEKINGDVNRPTDRPTNRQGEYRAICLFRKLENRKKAEICNNPYDTLLALTTIITSIPKTANCNSERKKSDSKGYDKLVSIYLDDYWPDGCHIKFKNACFGERFLGNLIYHFQKYNSRERVTWKHTFFNHLDCSPFTSKIQNINDISREL